MAPSPTLADAVEALRVFVKSLGKRQDVLVTRKFIGRKAPAADLRRLRATASYQRPAELLDLLALLNGVDVAWHWVEGEGGGGMRIPGTAIEDAYQFETDEENYNDFGPGKVSAGFDGYVGERATWLVADGPADVPNARLLFADQGEGDDGTLVAGSIAEYLTRAVAAGLVDSWQRGEAASEDARQQMARLAAPPVVPLRIRPGVRVHGRFFAEGCRGTVLNTLKLPDTSGIGRNLTNPTCALVRYDIGLTAWTPSEQLRALPKKADLYEQYRADLRRLGREGETQGWAAALRTMGLLWGPLTSHSASGLGTANGSEIAAALLMPLPLPDALRLVQQVTAGIATVQATLPDQPELTEAERKLAFNQHDWRRCRWQGNWRGIVEQLVCGLMLRLAQEPPAGRAAFAPAALDAWKPASRPCPTPR